MAMKVSRDVFTPLTLGSFGLLAVTGVLMFFHLDSGLNKAAHEWLSWLLIAAVGGHVLSNLGSLKRHFQSTRTRSLLAGFAAVLALSFAPVGGNDKPPFVVPMAALARAPLPVLAQVAGVEESVLRERLAAAGTPAQADTASVAQLVGTDLRQQMGTLNRVLAQNP